MKNFIILLILLGFSGYLYADTYVNGYYKKNGTYVPGHYRTSPNSTKLDNYSTYPNYNPYNGRQGTKRYKNYNNYNWGTKKRRRRY